MRKALEEAFTWLKLQVEIIRQTGSLPGGNQLLEVFVKPIFSGSARLKENSVVSSRIRIGPSVA